jgi:hydroxyethylthiazole kinase-like uncharacterized protein yjeF
MDPAAFAYTTPLYPVAAIRAMEQAAGGAGLMARAGQAAATLAMALLPDGGSSVLVVAGPGNNGGDALVAARLLKQAWHRVSVVFAGERSRLPEDAAQAYDAWLAAGGMLEVQIPAAQFDLVIDGLFGIGLSKPLTGRHAALVQQINTLDLPVLALDIPSGLCADSGRVLGCAVRASHTLTFLGLKPGLFTLDGPDHAGTVHLTDLGVDGAAVPATPGALIELPPALPAPRLRNSHKGSFGSVGVLGGDTSMVGAALLAARAALLTGAGRVYAGLLADPAPAVDFGQPELMLRSAEALCATVHLSVLAAGPGLGQSKRAQSALRQALQYPAPLLLDADALILLAQQPKLRRLLSARTHASIVTPHPGEAASLLHCTVADIQADRIAAALRIARDCHAITVLKGAGSIIALADGRWCINGSGNPGMASAGMGDVLAGIIAGLIAQNMDAASATLLGVYLHGAAADARVAAGGGPLGLTASEVSLGARDLLNRWRAEQA